MIIWKTKKGDFFLSILYEPFLTLIYIADKIHLDLGGKIRSPSKVLESEIGYNDNQTKAIKKALMSSFSLIQGPPGI